MSTPYKFFKGKLYIIVTKEKILIRRIKPLKDNLELIPDNSNFNIINLSKGDVIEAWEVIGYFSNKTDAPTLISLRPLPAQ